MCGNENRVVAAAAVALALIATGCVNRAESSSPRPPSAVPSTPVPSAPVEPSATLPAEFTARVEGIGPAHVAKMGTSWKPGCPVPLTDLRVITMTHWDFEGAMREGELMVHERYATAITGVFAKLFDARYAIERMELANGYMGNDPPLAQRNNTVGFNCRAPVGGGRHRWSEHSYGRAVDINPDQNPYVSRSGRIEPLHGRPYVDRSLGEPAMLDRDHLAVRAFRAIGWRWGGDWSGTKDYMHFSATGR
jgi:hypothetical protein